MLPALSWYWPWGLFTLWPGKVGAWLSAAMGELPLASLALDLTLLSGSRTPFSESGTLNLDPVSLTRDAFFLVPDSFTERRVF